MSMISNIAGPIARYISGADKPKIATAADVVSRGEDSVFLSPESQALQESIAQNQSAAASVLGQDDVLGEQTMAALTALARNPGKIADLID